MSNPAIFLDRDGVINEDTGYVSQVDDFHFLPGVIDALQLLKKKAICWSSSPTSPESPAATSVKMTS